MLLNLNYGTELYHTRTPTLIKPKSWWTQSPPDWVKLVEAVWASGYVASWRPLWGGASDTCDGRTDPGDAGGMTSKLNPQFFGTDEHTWDLQQHDTCELVKLPTKITCYYSYLPSVLMQTAPVSSLHAFYVSTAVCLLQFLSPSLITDLHYISLQQPLLSTVH